jgi:PAS domain S-box-containing protein
MFSGGETDSRDLAASTVLAGRWITAGVALVSLLVIGMVVFSLSRSHDQAEARAHRTVENLSKVLGESITGSIDKIDLALQVATDEYARQLASGKVDAEGMTAFLGRQLGRLPAADNLRATDAQGLALYGLGVPTAPRVSMSDRDYYLRHRDNPSAGLVIGKPILARISKKWLLPLSRRVNRPDGSFGGVVYSAISVEYFDKMFAGIDLGSGGVISLRDADMGLIARHPERKAIGIDVGSQLVSRELQQRLQAGQTSGTYFTPTGSDDIPRIVAFHKLGDRPLFLIVGVGTDDYLREWRKETMQVAGLAGLFALISVIFAVMIHRALKRQIAATEVLAEQEIKFHIVADHTYDWEYWEGPGHELLYISPSCEPITGYASSEFLADPELIERIIHPDDRPLMAEHRRDAEDQDVAGVEFRILRRDGEIRWIAHGCRRVFERERKFLGRRVSNRDITERKRAEEAVRASEARLQLEIDRMPIAHIVWDTDFRAVSWNLAAEKIFGYTVAEALGRHPYDLIVPKTAQPQIDAIWRRLLAGSTSAYSTNENITKDGRTILCEWTNTPLIGPDGVLLGVMAMTQDITERKQAEQELKRHRDHMEELVKERTAELSIAKTAAEAANRAKSVFLANMSHELRTPLNAILGFAQIMERDPAVGQTHRQELATIGRAGRHLLSLINDVLEISRIEAGRTSVNNEPFDLNAMLTAVEEMTRVRAAAKQLDFKVERHGELPAYVFGDAHHLRQVLLNLLSNAVKFTERGEITLRVTAADGAIRFEVADTGLGIAPEEQEKLFQAFYQTAIGIANGEGTGLGLTISHEFVRFMGGELTVKSEPGQGSVFSFTLPLPASVAPPSAAVHGRVLGLEAGQSPPRILVAEDNADNRELMARILGSVGFEVKAVGNGQQAIDAFQHWQPQFIWMDMKMPVLDGFEATKAIRALPGGKDIKIAALTASAFREDRRSILAAGCDAVLAKPADEDQLFAVMGKLLGLRYRYAEAESPPAAPPLAASDLAVLPAALRGELRAAAEVLDMEATRTLVAQIREMQPALGDALERLASAYRFDRIAVLCGEKTS